VERDDERLGGRVCVGQVGAARGLNGEFCVRSFTADPDAIAAYGPLAVEGTERRLRLRVVGHRKEWPIVRAEEVDDRSKAEALHGARLYVDRSALPRTEEDEFYYADLIGLAARLAVEGAAGDGAPGEGMPGEGIPGEGIPGEPLGRVGAVHDFGAGPLLEIERPTASALLVPFTKAAVPRVDLAAGLIVVAPLPGLLGPVGELGAVESGATEAQR
jgi:16S rRNA processing protein RimM